MPNWSFNNFQISGRSEEMEKFYQTALKKSTEGELIFSFSNVIPQPEKIKNTISPSSSAKGVKWLNTSKLEHREGQLDEIFGIKNGLIPCENNTEEKCKQLIQEFRCDNWYDWNIENWGTKWNVEVDCFERSDSKFTCQFETAWTPPGLFLSRLQQLFPNLDIKLTYELEGCNECGVFVTEREGDVVTISNYHDEITYKSSDGRQIYFCNTDYDYKYVDTDEICHDIISENPFE